METCAVCHKESGSEHQAFYDELYQDGGIAVSDLTYKFSGDTTTITFKMTKEGVPISGKSVASLALYFAPWNGTKFQFEPASDRISLKGDLAFDGTTTTSTLVGKAPDFSKIPGYVVLYGRDEDMGRLPARVYLNKYPFAALLKIGEVNFVSAANNSGCEKCHTTPYLKHGYIYGQVGGDPATDMVTCKACHLDNGEGGHFEWQLLVDDPVKAAEFLAAGEEDEVPEEIATKYAYTTALVNDVHMSHAMEFAYPQSMANCVTCHEGKLDTVLSDANFKIETCKSCHPLTGAKAEAAEGDTPAWDTTGSALASVIPADLHGSMDLATTDCTMCHGEGKAAAGFKAIHTGYNAKIYTAEGIRYSDVITASIDSATFDGAVFTVDVSAVAAEGIAIDPATITPTILVGLYGYDTKDFIVGPHERLIDDNADGVLDRSDKRNMEAAAGEDHPRVKTVSAGGGKWQFTVDASAWKGMIDAGTVKRAEIGFLPALVVDGEELSVGATSRTFDLGANAFDDEAFSPIVETAKCETCHDALATEFHEPAYGGSVTVCRLCHITKSGGSHLEMASRSIDSYAHAIHSSQAFDIGEIDFSDPVQATLYTIHTEYPYPTHGPNCESCHVAGTYEVPDQSQSLPGLLSEASDLTNKTRKIGAIPSVVVGPASRACGGCHRAELINEDNAGELAVLNTHFQNGGYQIEAGENPVDTLIAAIEKMMAFFK